MGIAQRLSDWDSIVAQARRRVPRFAFDYFMGGAGAETCISRGRRVLDSITLLPQYSYAIQAPSTGVDYFGKQYRYPFGIAPVGMGDILWPGAAELLAAAAATHDVPFILSTYALVSLERIREIAGDNAWFQLYCPTETGLRERLIRRILKAGYRVLVVTVDVPAFTYRPREIRHGISVPLSFDPRTILQVASHPLWAARFASSGFPDFVNISDLAPAGMGVSEKTSFLSTMVEAHLSAERLAEVRREWPHALVVKGVLSAADAARYKAAGADALIISNHGGRQLDAAPAPVEMLPTLRDAVGAGYPMFIDGCVQSGLDIARLIAAGADMVFAGRSPYLTVAAGGRNGANHFFELFVNDLVLTLRQLGCSNVKELDLFVGKAIEKRPFDDKRQ